MYRALPLTALLLLGCSSDLPPPDAALSAQALASGQPALVPLDPLLAEGSRISRAQAAEGELQGRAAGLAGRRIAAPTGSDLTERERLLRERAERLRNTDI